ncbi:MAG TPA: 5-formyltetrahydrofolate cyclo-ligase [Acidimicrobiales bacterium]|nr:5-formyltetrahydrofolate cyclo-ligase [Acidimicrobiales bacterium]
MATAWDALQHPSPHAPLYERVRLELERMAVERALTDTSPLPAEPRLMQQFRVSRGTLRRAIDALVREGLLYTEQGRGTFVNQEERVRRVVFQHLIGVAVPDSRSDLDLRSFVADFAGREAADRAVLGEDDWAAARTVFLMPDNSVRRLRLHALEQGKRVLVPTFNFRRGLVLLDGTTLPDAAKPLASTLDGMEELGQRVTARDLASLERVDLVVTGATAATMDGRCIGRGEPYLALGWALLEELGLVDERVLLIAVMHDCQVIDSAVPAIPECTVDVVATPTRVIRCHSPGGSAAGQRRTQITRDRLHRQLGPSGPFPTS